MLGISLVRLTIICLKCICYTAMTLAVCVYGTVVGINIPEIIRDLLIALRDLLSTKIVVKLLALSMDCLILISEFSLNLMLFAFSMIYRVMVYVVEIAMKCQNMYCYFFSLFAFCCELFSKLIMGRGNAVNYALSWIVCLSLCYLYIDYKFFRVLNVDFPEDGLQERDVNENNINERIPCDEAEQEQNISNEDNEPDKDKIYVNRQNVQDCARSLEEEFDSYLTLRMKMISTLKGQMKRGRLTELRENDHIQPSTSRSEQHTEMNSDSNTYERCNEEQLRNEGEEEGNLQLLCTVCMEEDRSVATFPCGHTHVCFTCVTAIMTDTKKCPMCSTDIHYYKTIFL